MHPTRRVYQTSTQRSTVLGTHFTTAATQITVLEVGVGGTIHGAGMRVEGVRGGRALEDSKEEGFIGGVFPSLSCVFISFTRSSLRTYLPFFLLLHTIPSFGSSAPG
jgi:hypothetical protein